MLPWRWLKPWEMATIQRARPRPAAGGSAAMAGGVSAAGETGDASLDMALPPHPWASPGGLTRRPDAATRGVVDPRGTGRRGRQGGAQRVADMAARAPV